MPRAFLRPALLGGLLSLFFAQGAHAAGMPWEKTYQSAVAKAKKTNRVLMVDFYTDWCGWCKRLDKDTYSNPEVIRLAGQVVPLKVNAEREGRALAKQHGVTGFPTILFLTPAGQVAGRIGGYVAPGPFAGELKRIAAEHAELPALEAKLKAKPGSPTVAARLAQVYARRGDHKRALSLLAVAEKGDPKNLSGVLTKTYNAVGDAFTASHDYGRAIPLFRKAVRVGKSVDDVIYARTSIIGCLLAERKYKEAVPELQHIAAMPNAPAEDRKQARDLLSQLHQRGVVK